MKVYLHHEASPAFTKLIKVDPSRHVVLQDLVEEFLDAYRAKHGAAGACTDASRMQAFNADRKPLQLAAKVGKLLSNQADVFLEALPEAHAGPATPGSTQQHAAPSTITAATGAQTPAGPGSSAAGQPAGPAAAGAAGTAADAAAGSEEAERERERATRMLQQYMEKAHTAAAASNFRLAGDIYTQLLELLPDQQELLAPAASMWLQQARLPARAEPLARRLVAAAPAVSSAHQLLGDCMMALSRPQEAVQCYDAALVAAREAGEPSDREADLQVAMAQALYACDQEPGLQEVAAKITMDVLSVHEAHWEGLRLYARIAEQQGMDADALRVALRLLVARNTDSDVRALLARRLQAPGGLRTLYNELSVPDHSLGGVTDTGSGAGPNSNSTGSAGSGGGSGGGGGSGAGGKGVNNAAALAFLATCVKDLSAVDATIELLEKAASLDPQHTGYALNLAHAWELHQRLDKVVAVAARSMQGAADRGLQLGGGTDLQACAQLLQALPPLQPPVTSLAWRDNATWAPPPTTFPTASAATTTTAPATTTTAPATTTAPTTTTTTPAPTTTTPGPSAALQPVTAAMAGMDLAPSCQPPTNQPSTGTPKVQYSSAQLDLLALAFTAAKALYVGGALSTAERLVNLLLPARDASEQPLHTTLIRNEAAYFGCVVQLVTTHPPPACGVTSGSGSSSSGSDRTQLAPACGVGSGSGGAADSSGTDSSRKGGSAAGDEVTGSNGSSSGGASTSGGQACVAGSSSGSPRPIYLVGDSHCLSAAWHEVTLRGERRLLHPVLVTGCKIWHLRPASSFYPKAQFKASMDALPTGSQLVLLLGEIDCREGLLLAVQKCKYDTMAQGVEATVAIYLQVMAELISVRGFEVFVHPVPPVLNETRPVVTLFNQILKKKVLATAATPAAAGRLHFLDFGQDLLTLDGAGLAPGLQFDGTHLSPSYVTFLNKAMA